MRRDIYFPGEITDPRKIPELRQALIELAEVDGAWEKSEVVNSMKELSGGSMGSSDQMIELVKAGAKVPDELKKLVQGAHTMASNHMRWNRRTLEEAQLIYVTDELTDVVDASSESAAGPVMCECPWPAYTEMGARRLARSRGRGESNMIMWHCAEWEHWHCELTEEEEERWDKE